MKSTSRNKAKQSKRSLFLQGFVAEPHVHPAPHLTSLALQEHLFVEHVLLHEHEKRIP